MFHLYDLPVHLVGVLFGSWLDMRSLLALDTASCSVTSRRSYLEVVRSTGFCFRSRHQARIARRIDMK
jgi:hypothetical protein